MSTRNHLASAAWLRASPQQAARFALLASEFGFPLAIDDGASVVDVIGEVLSLPGRTAEFRAGVALLGASGAYPMSRQVSDVAASVRSGHHRTAVRSVLECMMLQGRMATDREFVVGSPIQIDVTSVSRELTVTGIPRVVHGLITGMGAEDGLHVWSHGCPGPVRLLEDGTYAFDPEIWQSHGSTFWPYRTMRRMHRRLKGAAARSRAAAMTYRTVLWALGPLARIMNSGRGPKRGVLFVDNEIVLPEVCQPDVADRMLTWRRVTDTGRIRVLVHDLLPVVAPEYFPGGHPEVFLAYTRAVVGADVVITTTTHSAEQVHALARLHCVPPPAVRAVPLPVTSRTWVAEPVERGFIPQFTCVGALEPRKNHRAVLLASAELARRAFPVILNLVGNHSALDDETLEALTEARGAGVDVRLFSSATDGMLRGLMEASEATVFMSWAEGYGLPVLESLACRVPVLVSDVDPMREFARYGGVVLVDPADCYALADAMQMFASGPAYRRSLVESIRNDDIPVSVPDWARQVMTSVSTSADTMTQDVR